MEIVRIGMIGCGYMGLTYSEAIAQHVKGAQLVAVAGGQRAPQLAAEYKVEAEASVEALLQRRDLDGVIVTTPDQNHWEHTLQAAAAGKHVLVEKPMAPTVAQCDAMIAACQAAGVNLAVVTLAGGVAIEELIFRNPRLTGGFGGTKVPSPSLAGVDLGISRGGDYPSPVFGLLVLAVLTALALALVVVRRGDLGRRCLAVRANERGAAAAGVDVVTTKLGAFAASAFVAGWAGVLLGYSQGQLSFGSFSVFVSLSFLAVAYVGGIASVPGALIGGALAGGGIVFSVLDRFAGWGRYQALFAGLGLIVVSVLRPDGLAGPSPRLRLRRHRSTVDADTRETG